MLTFLTISGENITTMLGYTTDLLTDLNPLLLIVVGVGVGIFVFWAIVNAIKH
jgi:F0F1-type ATP synthase assembly protein I